MGDGVGLTETGAELALAAPEAEMSAMMEALNSPVICSSLVLVSNGQGRDGSVGSRELGRVSLVRVLRVLRVLQVERGESDKVVGT